MKGARYKKSGWFGESYRHYLAAKGITSSPYKRRFFAKGDRPMRPRISKESLPERFAIGEFARSQVDKQAREDFKRYLRSQGLPVREGSPQFEEGFEEFYKENLQKYQSMYEQRSKSLEAKYDDINDRIDDKQQLINDLLQQNGVATTRELDMQIAELRQTIRDERDALGDAPDDLLDDLEQLTLARDVIRSANNEVTALRDERDALTVQPQVMRQVAAYTREQLVQRGMTPAEIASSIPGWTPERVLEELQPKMVFDPVKGLERKETKTEVRDRLTDELLSRRRDDEDLFGRLRVRLSKATEDRGGGKIPQERVGRRSGKTREGFQRTPEVATERTARLKELQTAFAQEQQQDLDSEMQSRLRAAEVLQTGEGFRIGSRLDVDLVPPGTLRQSFRRVDPERRAERKKAESVFRQDYGGRRKKSTPPKPKRKYSRSRGMVVDEALLTDSDKEYLAGLEAELKQERQKQKLQKEIERARRMTKRQSQKKNEGESGDADEFSARKMFSKKSVDWKVKSLTPAERLFGMGIARQAKSVEQVKESNLGGFRVK